MESRYTKTGREDNFSPNSQINMNNKRTQNPNYYENNENRNGYSKPNNKYNNNGGERKNSDLVNSKPVFFNSSKLNKEENERKSSSNNDFESKEVDNLNSLPQQNYNRTNNNINDSLKNMNINNHNSTTISTSNKPITFSRQGFTNESKQTDINKDTNKPSNLNSYSYNDNSYNNNSNYSNFEKNKQMQYNQNYTTPKQSINWFSRYNKNDFYKNRKIDEDNKEFLDEHVKLLEKKEGNLSKLDIGINLYNCDFELIKSKTTINNFNDIGLEKVLLENLKSMKFENLTPIQKTVIPYTVEGEDIMGCAQTGSGKTVAFLLPIIDKMLKRGPPNVVLKIGTSYPVTLILVPTRELVTQIFKVARLLSKDTGISVMCLFGGVAHEDQLKDLKYGVDILISTTGRLLDFLQSKVISLRLVETLIIDEADRLLEMGFEKQLYEILNLHDFPAKQYRQTLLFSATFCKDIKRTAKTLLKEKYLVAASNIDEYDMNKDIEQKFSYVEECDKPKKLHEILQASKGNVIIFLDRKKLVDELLKILTKANYSCIAIHGDKTQFDRNNALDKFKEGKIPILIGTDVIGRGIDFPNVSCIINYDTPKNIDDYIHRIGRTGRCGSKGISHSFINERTKPLLRDLYYLLSKQGVEIPSFIEEMYYHGDIKGKHLTYNDDDYEGDSNYQSKSNMQENYFSLPSFKDTNQNVFYMPTPDKKMSWRK